MPLIESQASAYGSGWRYARSKNFTAGYAGPLIGLDTTEGIENHRSCNAIFASIVSDSFLSSKERRVLVENLVNRFVL